MVNASTQKWIDKLRPPKPVVASSITGQMGAPTPAPQPVATQNAAPSFIGQPVKKVATTQNPVLTRSATPPSPMTPPATDITNRDDNKIKDYIAWAELNPTQLDETARFNMTRGAQILADRSYQQQNIDPRKAQVTSAEQQLKDQQAKLAERDKQLADARRKELELTYGKRIAGEQEAGAKTMSAAQGVLSFSGFGRSTYAAEKQTEIQSVVNENIGILNAERDLAMRQYEAELAGATAEELAGYNEMINAYRMKSAEYSVQLAKQMNEYNSQTAASYQERVGNILNLANSMQVTELTPAQQEEASAYATLLLDDKGNINEKLLADIPPMMKGAALKKAAELKGQIQPSSEMGFMNVGGGLVAVTDPKTGKVTFQQGNVQQEQAEWKYNEKTGMYERTSQTGQLETIKPDASTPTTQSGIPIQNAIATALEKCKTGAQCGKFVNDVLQSSGLPRLVGDSYQSKDMAISQIGIAIRPEDIGSGSIFAYPVKGSNYGHIGIVTAVNTDGTINIMDYNYKGDQKQRERVNVDPREISNMGGKISKPIIREDTVKTTSELSPIAKAVVDGDIDMKAIKDNVKTDEEVAQVIKEVQAYKKDNPGEATKVQSSLMTSLVNDLTGLTRAQRISAGATDASYLGGLYSMFSPGSVDLKSTFDQLKTTLTAENLINMKAQGATFGALSNEELRLIADSATRLRLDMSDAARKKELQYIADKFAQGSEKQQSTRTITRTGKTDDGRTVVQYSDGSVEYK